VYTQRVIASYFEGRLLLYVTDSGQSTHRVTGGVPQGSVLGPLLWNAMYDGILRNTITEGARLIGFADDMAIVVTAKKLPDAERICNEAPLQPPIEIVKYLKPPIQYNDRNEQKFNTYNCGHLCLKFLFRKIKMKYICIKQ